MPTTANKRFATWMLIFRTVRQLKRNLESKRINQWFDNNITTDALVGSRRRARAAWESSRLCRTTCLIAASVNWLSPDSLPQLYTNLQLRHSWWTKIRLIKFLFCAGSDGSACCPVCFYFDTALHCYFLNGM